MTTEEKVTAVIEQSACIYGLYDKGGALRYIGKAKCEKARLKGHMRDSRRRNTPLYAWLRKHGEPEVRVLERVVDDWQEAERRLIAEARASGENLLNLADGGDQPYCPPEVRSKNAKLLNRRFMGLEPWPEKMLTREALIKDTYNWLADFARKRNLIQLAARVELKKREQYRLDPKTYRAWKPKCQAA